MPFVTTFSLPGIKLKVDGELYAVDPDDLLLNLVPKGSKVRVRTPVPPLSPRKYNGLEGQQVDKARENAPLGTKYHEHVHLDEECGKSTRPSPRKCLKYLDYWIYNAGFVRRRDRFAKSQCVYNRLDVYRWRL